MYIHVCFNEMRRKEERSKQGHTNNKAKQHSTPKAVTFPKKNEPPRVGLEPMTLYTLHVHVVIGRNYAVIIDYYHSTVTVYAPIH